MKYGEKVLKKTQKTDEIISNYKKEWKVMKIGKENWRTNDHKRSKWNSHNFTIFEKKTIQNPTSKASKTMAVFFYILNYAAFYFTNKTPSYLLLFECLKTNWKLKEKERDQSYRTLSNTNMKTEQKKTQIKKILHSVCGQKNETDVWTKKN